MVVSIIAPSKLENDNELLKNKWLDDFVKVKEEQKKSPLRRIWKWIVFFQYTGGFIHGIKEDNNGYIKLVSSKVFATICLGSTIACLLFQVLSPKTMEQYGYSGEMMIEIGRQDGMQDTDLYSIFISYGIDLVSMVTLPILDYHMKQKLPVFVNQLHDLEQTLIVSGIPIGPIQ